MKTVTIEAVCKYTACVEGQMSDELYEKFQKHLDEKGFDFSEGNHTDPELMAWFEANFSSEDGYDFEFDVRDEFISCDESV